MTARVSLPYRPPLDWPGLVRYLDARATPGVEVGDGHGVYRRSIRLQGHQGYLAVYPARSGDALLVEPSDTLVPVLAPLTVRVRRLFDLDADPCAIAAHLADDAVLGPLVSRRPGLQSRAPSTDSSLRSARCWASR